MEILRKRPQLCEDDAQPLVDSILPAPKLKGGHTPSRKLPPGTEFADLRNTYEFCVARKGQNSVIEAEPGWPRSARSDEYPSRTDSCYPRNFPAARCLARFGW